MTQHYRNNHWDSDSVCGSNMVGRRTPDDFLIENVTCIFCRAIVSDRPLYKVSATDEDGYTDTQHFDTLEEQMAAVEEAWENGAEQVTISILTVDAMKDGEE